MRQQGEDLYSLRCYETVDVQVVLQRKPLA